MIPLMYFYVFFMLTVFPMITVEFLRNKEKKSNHMIYIVTPIVIIFLGYIGTIINFKSAKNIITINENIFIVLMVMTCIYAIGRLILNKKDTLNIILVSNSLIILITYFLTIKII